MRVTQALVAIGGRATRLRASGISVPVSKSFLVVHGKPLLYWTLASMHMAGVRRIVLCANADIQLHEAELTLEALPVRFDSVKFFRDAGVGMHGLPHQAQHLLDDEFIFECGHSVVRPEHYRVIDAAKDSDHVVFSAFNAHPSNVRQPVTITDGLVTSLTQPSNSGHALAHPFVLDLAYAQILPKLGFDITRLIAHFSESRKLRYVLSDLPPEFDLAQELEVCRLAYAAYLPKLEEMIDGHASLR